MKQADATGLEISPVLLSVACRPDRSNWWLVAFFGVFGVLPFFIPWSEKQTADLPKDWALVFFLSACFLIPTVIGAIWLLRARIVADQKGLRWRVLGPWHRAGWDDVTDYYEAVLPGNQRSSGTPFVIEVGVKRVKFRSDWLQSEKLCAFTERQAKRARVRQWGIYGARREDEWPRVFDYQLTQTRRTLIALRLMLLSLLLLWCWIAGPRLVRTYGTAEWEWNAAMVALLGLVLVGQGVLLSLIFRSAKFALRRADQRVIVSPEWIALEEGNHRTQLLWSEITDYYVLGSGQISQEIRYVIETKRKVIDFSLGIRDVPLLKRIVTQYASAAKAWRREEDDVLGEKTARWSGGCEGHGQRIYHYRTRTNRALLAFLGFFAVAPWAVSLFLHAVGLSDVQPAKSAWWGNGLIAVAFCWSFWRYRHAQIRTDAEGITQFSVAGRRRTAWADVKDFYLSGGDVGVFGNVIRMDGQNIRFWAGIAYADELQEEIARRAIRSVARTWRKKEEKASVANR